MKRRLISVALGAVLLCAIPAGAQTPNTGNTLVVKIENAKPAKGQFLVSLFKDEATYMKAPLAERTMAVDEKGEMTLSFVDLGAGQYALSIIHDKDSDGKLDTNFLGIPTEKVGFSNNARPKMGPAPWEKAQFTLGTGITTQTIVLGKAKRD